MRTPMTLFNQNQNDMPKWIIEARHYAQAENLARRAIKAAEKQGKMSTATSRRAKSVGALQIGRSPARIRKPISGSGLGVC
jgi:hypothetical protein